MSDNTVTEDEDIIKKYYPDLRSEKELELLVCLGWTMKDLSSTEAYAIEVEARTTENLPPWLESDQEKIQNKLLPDEYKNILSNLISKNIVQEKTLETIYGGPPNTYIKNDQYLTFTNEDMTNEVLANT